MEWNHTLSFLHHYKHHPGERFDSRRALGLDVPLPNIPMDNAIRDWLVINHPHALHARAQDNLFHHMDAPYHDLSEVPLTELSAYYDCDLFVYARDSPFTTNSPRNPNIHSIRACVNGEIYQWSLEDGDWIGVDDASCNVQRHVGQFLQDPANITPAQTLEQWVS